MIILKWVLETYVADLGAEFSDELLCDGEEASGRKTKQLHDYLLT
jgi:hypothetical protein